MPLITNTEPPNPVNASDIENIYGIQLELADLLDFYGVSVSPLENPLASKLTQYFDISSIYNKIERNFDKINDNEYQSAYYIPNEMSKKRGNFEPNRQEWEQWINILNDIYDIITGNVGKWQYLVCVNKYPLIDGKKIVLRGETQNVI